MSPTFSAQLLGQTEKAANAILERLLAEPGLTEPQWVMLSITVMSGGSLDRQRLVERAVAAAQFSEAEAQARLSELADAQLLHVPDDELTPLKLTHRGRQVHTDIRAAVSQITQRLWGDLPVEDLDAAGRVLNTVLARANAELARA
jgi:hypothetical protein